jgi:hypothetical protein
MGFRMTDSPFSRTSPNALDTDVDGFPFPSAATTPAAHFNARLAIQDGGRDPRLWLSCASACFSLAGPQGPLAIRDMRRR